MKMNRIFVVACVLALLSGCAHPKVVGTWQTQGTVRVWGVDCVRIVRFRPNGKCDFTIARATWLEDAETLQGTWRTSEKGVVITIKGETGSMNLVDPNTMILAPGTLTSGDEGIVFKKR